MTEPTEPRLNGWRVTKLFMIGAIVGAAISGVCNKLIENWSTKKPAMQEQRGITNATPASVAPVERIATPAADASDPVAFVDDRSITLRQVEDALLRKEGVEEIETWLHERLSEVAWEKLGDDTVLLAIDQARITRRDIAEKLLQRGSGTAQALAPKAREDLIGIAVVERALSRAGIALDKAMLDAEYVRVEASFHAERERKKEPKVAYEDYLRTTKNMNVDQFKAQVGFRMLAGLHALVFAEARSAVGEPALAAWFDKNRARFDQTEAVDLSTIYIPYRTDRELGRPVTAKDRDDLMDAFITFHVDITKGRSTYEFIWKNYAASWEHTGEGGRIGWIGRDGRRPDPKDRPLPKALIEDAFANVGRLPCLLMPIQSDSGIDLGRVNAYRKEKKAVFAEVRAEVLKAMVEEQLDQRTQDLLARLRDEAKVRYQSLPEAIRKRTGR